MRDTYRLAASMLLLRPGREELGAFEMLILHKPRKRDAWQLPQGGVEGNETLEECAVRELQEEAGISDVTMLGKSETVYQYDFPLSYRRFRPDNICGQKIGFVFALTDQTVRVKVDKKEVNDHRWITARELSKFLKRKPYLELVEDLYEEALGMMKMGGK